MPRGDDVAPAEPPATLAPEQSALGAILARGRLRSTLVMFGPAFVAAVAYVDPGNFATNLEGGARFGFSLLWVVLVASLMAMLVQYLSAKLGVVTGENLCEVFRRHYGTPACWAMWVQAEAVSMATDVAEFVGAALGLNLIFHVPLLPAGLITAVVAFALLSLHSRGFRRFEVAITALFGLILLGFLYDTISIGPRASAVVGGLVPHLGGAAYAYLAVAIVGATVMPHVVYLHSELTSERIPSRDDGERRRILRFTRLDVAVALGLAAVVNMAMLWNAAQLFHGRGLAGDSMTAAHAGIAQAVGGGAALVFAAALLASGLSSSGVGTFAGQVVMAGFVGLRLPLHLRRLMTMVPALVVLGAGVSPTRALVLSQVVLSFGVPFALVPLVRLTGRADVMGAHANHRLTSWAAWAVSGAIAGLNVWLVAQALAG